MCIDSVGPLATDDAPDANFVLGDMRHASTHVAVTAFPTRAERNAIVRAGERRAGDFPPVCRFVHRTVHAPPAQPF